MFTERKFVSFQKLFISIGTYSHFDILILM
jgi:hypothetical protein